MDARTASQSKLGHCEREIEATEALDRLGHEGILVALGRRLVGDREAQVRPCVVPGDAADGLLGDEELRALLRRAEGTSSGARWRADVEEVRPARHACLEADPLERGDEFFQ